MKIYKYKNYAQYVEEQTKANKIKLGWTYVKRPVIDSICSNYSSLRTEDGVVKSNEDPSFIICHGTRKGTEQKLFKINYPNAEIIGTEISDTATLFRMTIQHDFTIPIEEWIGKADIVYSNSFDHTIDPVRTINTWRDQLKTEGRLYLEYNENDRVCEPSDPLDASLREVWDMIIENGLEIETKLKGMHGGKILVCKRKEND